MKSRRLIGPAPLAAAWSFALAAERPVRPHDLSEASLEELMNIEVTSVSKKGQKLSPPPAAIYGIAREDIRRSGMTNMTDLMRMVPGMDVGQIQGGAWTVSARGFNDNYSNRLLMLVDGRSVYSPTHAGVNWEVRDTLIEDIERIEVIRFPGATLWGANAVNGVINIITKPAKETQGALITAGVSDQGQSLAGVRYGGEIGKIGHYRSFTKYLRGRGLENSEGMENRVGDLMAAWTRRLDISTGARAVEGASPRQQFQVGSNVDISSKLQFDTALYYVSALPALPVTAYARLDARLGYRFRRDGGLSFSGQNLQGRRHAEHLSIAPFSLATIGRSFNMKLNWSF